ADHHRNPWCASSSVSVATLLFSAPIDGPCHRTGITPLSFHEVMGSPSVPSAVISAEDRVIVPCISFSHLDTFSESLSPRRVSLMFVYLGRTGSWGMNSLLPPSSRCSSTASTPSPSQPVNTPRAWLLSITTLNRWATAGSALGSDTDR